MLIYNVLFTGELLIYILVFIYMALTASGVMLAIIVMILANRFGEELRYVLKNYYI